MTEDDARLNESYILRLWRDSPRRPWRATVHKVRTGQEEHFACLEELWAYLRAEMAAGDQLEEARLKG